jgi:GrpB-like predicted nucleotidyltransferase (UPF0157 family)
MKDLIKEYNPEWKRSFDNIKMVLNDALKEYSTVMDIEHVGSTAIPGMVAKPILDIDIIIKDKSLLSIVTSLLLNFGYINRGEQGIAGRFAFRQSSEYVPFTNPETKKQSHHLYVCYSDSLAVKNHLLIKDALMKDSQLVAKYSQLKMDLVNEKGMTREKYTNRKTDFILELLVKSGLDSNELDEISNANK